MRIGVKRGIGGKALVGGIGRKAFPIKQRTPQSHIRVASQGAAIVANTGKAGAGEKYFRRWDGDGIGEFSIFDGCDI